MLKITTRRVVLILIINLFFGAVAFIGTGEFLISPVSRSIGAPPPDLHATALTLAATPNETIAGWFSKGKPEHGAILMLHGVRGDRRAMLARARFLKAAGYTVMLIDLPAHGESTGEKITFGLNEAIGVKAALAYLREKLPDEKIGVIGVSLGAASFVLAEQSAAPDAVILESMYPTIKEATVNRLAIRLGSIGDVITPLLLRLLTLRTGIDPVQLQPIAKVSKIGAPVLIASGTLDQHTTVVETQRIFQAANEPKELWLVEGAAHIDLHQFNPQAYEAKVLPFLAKHLHAGG